MTTTLQQLAEINISGAPFLFAYRITWMICGVLWKKIQAAYAAIATLFQGMVALPVALGFLYWIGAFEYRPDIEKINQLSLLMSMSQLLILPLLIVMYQKKHYTLVPFVLRDAGAVHFLLYAWLYQTIAYIIMPVLIAIVIAIIYATDKSDCEFISKSTAAKSCYSTGILLVLTGTYFIVSL